ncbi:hypothetical protein WDW37_15795 [Bdellovibrionota bacterium FG-1]
MRILFTFFVIVLTCPIGTSANAEELLSFGNLTRVVDQNLKNDDIARENHANPSDDNRCENIFHQIEKVEESIRTKRSKKNANISPQATKAVQLMAACLKRRQISFHTEKTRITIAPNQDGPFLNQLAFSVGVLNPSCRSDVTQCVRLVYDPTDDQYQASAWYDTASMSIHLGSFLALMNSFTEVFLHEATHASYGVTPGPFQNNLGCEQDECFKLDQKYLQISHSSIEGGTVNAGNMVAGYEGGYSLGEIDAFTTEMVLKITRLKGLYQHPIAQSIQYISVAVTSKAAINGLKNLTRNAIEKMEALFSKNEDYQVSFLAFDYWNKVKNCPKNTEVVAVHFKKNGVIFGVPLSCTPITNEDEVQSELEKTGKAAELLALALTRANSTLLVLKDIDKALDGIVSAAALLKMNPDQDRETIEILFENTKSLYEKIQKYRELSF